MNWEDPLMLAIALNDHEAVERQIKRRADLRKADWVRR